MADKNKKKSDGWLGKQCLTKAKEKKGKKYATFNWFKKNYRLHTGISSLGGHRYGTGGRSNTVTY